MADIFNLLTLVEQKTGGRFITANFAGASAEKNQQYWFNESYDRKVGKKLFSNRPYHTGICARKVENLGEQEQFIRLDLENLQNHHEQFTTEQDIQDAVDWAKEANALGVLPTKHGIHIYFLSNKKFNWSNLSNHISPLLASYKGRLQLDTQASFARNNWSKTHKQTLAYFNESAAVSFSDIMIDNKITTIMSQPLSVTNGNQQVTKVSAPTFQKGKKGGSESHKHQEFSNILRQVVAGTPLSSIPMLYHKADVLAKVLQRPEYKWVYEVKAKSTFDLIGKNSHSRPIQRDFTFWGHLKHAISDLAQSNYSMAGIFQQFATKEYDDIRTQLIAREGVTGWMPKLEEHIIYLRTKYANKTGLYLVSPELLKQTFQLLRTHRRLTVADIQTHIIGKNKQRNALHTARGTSKRTAYRIVKILEECAILVNGKVQSKGNKHLLNKCIELSKYEENTNSESIQETSEAAGTVQCPAIATPRAIPDMSSVQQSTLARDTPQESTARRTFKQSRAFPSNLQEVP